MTLKDNTISNCFTLFICGRPCHLSSHKDCFGNFIFIWEQLVYSVMGNINIMSLYYYLINTLSLYYFSKTTQCSFKMKAVSGPESDFLKYIFNCVIYKEIYGLMIIYSEKCCRPHYCSLFKSTCSCSGTLLTRYLLLHWEQTQFSVFASHYDANNTACWLAHLKSKQSHSRARTHGNDLCSCTCLCIGGGKSSAWFPQLHQPGYISLRSLSAINKAHIVSLIVIFLPNDDQTE